MTQCLGERLCGCHFEMSNDQFLTSMKLIHYKELHFVLMVNLIATSDLTFLQNALKYCLRTDETETISLKLASRTDVGVHALKNALSFYPLTDK